MSGNKTRYYWDACIYIAWLNQEAAYAKWLPSINAIAKVNKERGNIIITSVMTLMEVLESKLGADQETQFQNCFRYGTHELYEIDVPIVNKARKYRDFYLSHPLNGKVLTIPDALHLATASIHSVDECHTFDDGKKGGCSLLALNGNLAGEPLKICRPEVIPKTPLEEYLDDVLL